MTRADIAIVESCQSTKEAVYCKNTQNEKYCQARRESFLRGNVWFLLSCLVLFVTGLMINSSFDTSLQVWLEEKVEELEL